VLSRQSRIHSQTRVDLKARTKAQQYQNQIVSKFIVQIRTAVYTQKRNITSNKGDRFKAQKVNKYGDKICVIQVNCTRSLARFITLFLTAVFSSGCLLPRVGRADVQWSQIRFSGSEPRVVGSSWRSFPVWWSLANRSSCCTVMVFISSTGCDVQPQNLERRLHVGKRVTVETLLDLSVSDSELSMGPFCVSRPNPSADRPNPSQPTTSETIWTQPDPTQH